MRYLICGAGWLGNYCKSYLGESAELWNSNINTISCIPQQFEVIINTAGKTDIDSCEKQKWDAVQSNVLGAYSLANLCKDRQFVHFSSACVFESKDKNDIKYEDSKPNPQCFYSETKLMAEKLIQEVNPNALILRIRLPLSEVSHPRNTITKLFSYPFLNMNQESVTVIEDMIPVLMNLIRKKEKGIFHMVNEGYISPVEIMRAFGRTDFTKVLKSEQDARFEKEGRAKRVTAYIGSKRIKLLPNIRERMKTLAQNYR